MAPVVSRRIFPQEFLVTHYDSRQKLWIADATNSDLRFEGETRNAVMDQVYAYVMNPPKQTRRGRPKRDRYHTSVTLPAAIKDYLALMAQTTECSWSAFISYLIAKAYAAWQMQIAEELPESERFESDDDGWVLAQYRALGIERPTTKDAGAVVKELRADNEATMTALAAKIRETMDSEKNKREAEYAERKAELMKLETQANEVLDQSDV